LSCEFEWREAPQSSGGSKSSARSLHLICRKLSAGGMSADGTTEPEPHYRDPCLRRRGEFGRGETVGGSSVIRCCASSPIPGQAGPKADVRMPFLRHVVHPGVRPGFCGSSAARRSCGGGMTLDVPADDWLHCVMIFSCSCPSAKNGCGVKDMAETRCWVDGAIWVYRPVVAGE